MRTRCRVATVIPGFQGSPTVGCGRLAIFGSRGTWIHHAAPGCLGCVSFVPSGATDVAVTGSSTRQGGSHAVHSAGWRFLGAKLSGSNNDVPLSDAATGRRARKVGIAGLPSPIDRLPAATREVSGLASRLQPGSMALRGRDPGTATVEPCLRADSCRVRSSRLFRYLLRSMCNEVHRSRGLVPQVLPRPGGSRERPPPEMDPLANAPSGAAIRSSFPAVTLVIPRLRSRRCPPPEWPLYRPEVDLFGGRSRTGTAIIETIQLTRQRSAYRVQWGLRTLANSQGQRTVGTARGEPLVVVGSANPSG